MNGRKLATVLAALAACGASPREVARRGDVVLGPCAFPPPVPPFSDATGTGCFARSILSVCEVPSGSILHADGTITTPAGGTVRCDPACNADEYSYECRAPPAAAIPEPERARGCRILPLVTPAGTLFHCCPCL
jgi:hypothetical protein